MLGYNTFSATLDLQCPGGWKRAGEWCGVTVLWSWNRRALGEEVPGVGCHRRLLGKVTSKLRTIRAAEEEMGRERLG